MTRKRIISRVPLEKGGIIAQSILKDDAVGATDSIAVSRELIKNILRMMTDKKLRRIHDRHLETYKTALYKINLVKRQGP